MIFIENYVVKSMFHFVFPDGKGDISKSYCMNSDVFSSSWWYLVALLLRDTSKSSDNSALAAAACNRGGSLGGT